MWALWLIPTRQSQNLIQTFSFGLFSCLHVPMIWLECNYLTSETFPDKSSRWQYCTFLSKIPKTRVKLPVAWWSVIQRAIRDLCFVIQYYRAFFQCKSQQVFTYYYNSNSSTANVLLSTSKNHTKLMFGRRKEELDTCIVDFATNTSLYNRHIHQLSSLENVLQISNQVKELEKVQISKCTYRQGFHSMYVYNENHVSSFNQHNKLPNVLLNVM